MPAAETEVQGVNTAYRLSEDQIESFGKKGYLKIKDLLPPEVLRSARHIIHRKVRELYDIEIRKSQDVNYPSKDTTLYQKAFTQVCNLWRECETIKSFVFSKRLARVAADLLAVDHVRLYHDQALFKEAGGGKSAWHADQFYWPLQSEKVVTAWIPLVPVSLEMGPLGFASGSHEFDFERNTEMIQMQEEWIEDRLHENGYAQDVGPFELGEVSFHYGWTLHRAGENRSDRCREVMTIIYMDADMRLNVPQNDNQKFDWKSWCPEAKPGEVIRTPLNPMLA